jgi:hypothetical protein
MHFWGVELYGRTTLHPKILGKMNVAFSETVNCDIFSYNYKKELRCRYFECFTK